MSDDGFYVMPDGREEVEWMRPYRQLVDSFAADLRPEQIKSLHDALDGVYDEAIMVRAADHVAERRLLRALLRVPLAAFPTEPPEDIEAAMADDRNDDAWLEDRGLL